MISLARETPDQSEVLGLFAQADARSAALYPGAGRVGARAKDLLRRGVVFFVARRDGVAIGCGGYVAAAPGAVEIMRLFVVEDCRAGQR